MTVTTVAGQATATLYQEIQQFYAQQMHLLDDGRAQEWSLTFTEDGVFGANAHPQAFEGREAIADSAGRACADYAARGVQRRHWLGMVSVEDRGGDAAYARCYALVLETERGGAPVIRASTSCEDRLVRVDGQWLVQDRRVTRDDLG